MTRATGQATIPSTTTAPSVVTLMRKMPQTMASIRSTKAQVDVSSVAMTSPDGRSVCQPWLKSMRWSYPFVMARPNERRVAPQLSQPPIRPKMVAATRTQRVGDDQRREGRDVRPVRTQSGDAPEQRREDQRRGDGVGQRPEHDGYSGAGERGAVWPHLTQAVRQGVLGRCIWKEGGFTHCRSPGGSFERMERRAHRWCAAGG